MEYPRVGLIRVTAKNRVLQDVRDSMRWPRGWSSD